MLNWGDYQIIVAIAECHTLSAAARRLDLNQSTVSRNLKRLESELRTTLFSTGSGIYQVTAEGAAYLKVGKQIEKAIDTLDTANVKSEVKGVIRLTMVEALVGYLIDRLSDFQRKFKEVSVELSGSNQTARLPRREFHAAIRLHREENSKSLIIKKLGEIGIAGYERRDGSSKSDWVAYESKLDDIPEERWLRAKTKSRHHNLHVSNYNSMEKAIESGLGHGLLPRFMGDHNFKLRCFTGEQAVLSRSIWFVTHADFRQDPAQKAFATWLFTQFEKDGDFLKG